tara:strand:+ start:737 stop:1048 length:312 start_codon:yes stop_codon:yes gene_type:complete
MNEGLATIVITLITVLFSAGAWRFYEKKISTSIKYKDDHRTDQNMYRDDLRDRVKRLEQLLTDSAEEKNKMRQQILTLTKEVSSLTVKVEFLEKENERLKITR